MTAAEIEAIRAERKQFTADPVKALAAAILGDLAAHERQPVRTSPGVFVAAEDCADRSARAALAYLDRLGLLARPPANPGDFPAAALDAYREAAQARADQVDYNGLSDREVSDCVVGAGLAAALQFLAPPGSFAPDVHDRAVDAFRRSASFASNTTDEQPRHWSDRAVRAGLHGAVNAGLMVAVDSMPIMATVTSLPNPCRRVDPHAKHLIGTVEAPVECRGTGGFD